MSNESVRKLDSTNSELPISVLESSLWKGVRFDYVMKLLPSVSSPSPCWLVLVHLTITLPEGHQQGAPAAVKWSAKQSAEWMDSLYITLLLAHLLVSPFFASSDIQLAPRAMLDIMDAQQTALTWIYA